MVKNIKNVYEAIKSFFYSFLDRLPKWMIEESSIFNNSMQDKERLNYLENIYDDLD